MKRVTFFLWFLMAVSMVFAAGVVEQDSSDVAKPLASIQEAPAQQEMLVVLEDPSGRDVARAGTRAVLEGVLHFQRGEWYLKSGETLYELHMGVLGHEEPDMFVEGAPAIIVGFVYQHHVAPISVETPQDIRKFWHEERYPLWSGGGMGRNQVSYYGERGNPSPMNSGL